MKIDQFDEKGDFEAWVRRIAVNKSIDFLRSNKRLEVPVEEQSLHLISKTFDYNGVNSKLTDEIMDKMLQSLPDLWRVVFNMYAIEGYAHKEIAQLTGVSELMSRKYLSRARKRLQELLKEQNFFFQLERNG